MSSHESPQSSPGLNIYLYVHTNLYNARFPPAIADMAVKVQMCSSQATWPMFVESSRGDVLDYL